MLASMILMIGLMATPYQSYGFEEDDVETTPVGGDPDPGDPSLWDEIVAWWDDLLE